ncbi:hypothetical protein Q5425_37205 [Amycolatopsis sp. A133]|uniref:hypothetical protein n=1 Tax=Amycolatopsis sp. A133 TaxID=3064472 RepID=UPI0027FFB66B|nr:hypothetical protein [Amycolatopsis sp. A133]MDQ7809395.1 hypothetical protein [Amycolatopsis sp. A133]
MSDEDDVLTALRRRSVLDGIAWAHRSAYGQLREDYNPAGGHKQSWIGFNAHVYLIDRLDRVFQCSDFAVPPGQDSVGRDVLAEGIADRDSRTMPLLPAGTVVRRDLNGSPGWSVAGWRWLLASYEFGQVAKIAWTERSETKQLVAKQPHAEEDGGLFPLSSLPGLPPLGELPDKQRELRRTLVLAHAMDPTTAEVELFFGRIRWNLDHGDAWVWRTGLTAGNGPSGGTSTPRQPSSPAEPSGDAVADADVRVRRRARDHDGPRAIGEA